MVTITSRGITQVILLWNCLVSQVRSEWLSVGDYGYGNGDGYFGYSGSSSSPLHHRRTPYAHDNYYRNSNGYGYGGHNKEIYDPEGYAGDGNGFGRKKHSSSGSRHYGQKHALYPHKGKEGYGYEKHDYTYEKQYYGDDDDGGGTVEHSGYRKNEEGHRREKGDDQEEHEHVHGKKKKLSGHRRVASDGYGDDDDEKTGYSSSGHQIQMSGYGSIGHPHAKALYGHCYNDFDCPMSQCCLKQGGVSVCMDLNANTGACSRRRECRHQQDCPSSQCCFPRDPNSLAKLYAATGYNAYGAAPYSHSYGAPYGHGYNGYNAYGGNNHLYMDGLCQPAGMRGQPCMMLLKGVTARGCPCTTGLTCNIPSGSNVGTCQ